MLRCILKLYIDEQGMAHYEGIFQKTCFFEIHYPISFMNIFYKLLQTGTFLKLIFHINV